MLLKRIIREIKNIQFKNKKNFQILNDVSNLTEEQIQIQEIALDFAKKRLVPNSQEWDQKKHFPIDVMRESAELGFGGIYSSIENGGCGLGRLEACLIFEALSYGCPVISSYLSIHNMCNWIISSFGSSDLKQKYLPQINSMDLLTSYCLTEPDSGSDAQSMKTNAVLSGCGNYYLLNGSKAFISGGGVSDLYIVMCKTGQKEISTLLVEKNLYGVSFGANENKLGWNAQPTCIVNFDQVKVPVQNLISQQGEGFKIAMKALDGGRINIASCSLGGAQFALEQTIDYVQNRKQFNKKLSDFQNTQFKIAEISANLVASRLMVRNSAVMLDNNHQDKTMYIAMAKRFATQQCSDVVDQCLQLHGGYGYLKDYPIEKIWRDLRVHQILEGTSEVMQIIISRKLLNKNN